MEPFCRAMKYLFRVDEFKLHVSSRPDDQMRVGRIVQECEQELPELQGATALVRQTLLLHFTCIQGQTGHNEHGSIPFPIFIPTQLTICSSHKNRTLLHHLYRVKVAACAPC